MCLNKLREILLNRRRENREVGIPNGGIFDGGVLKVYGEEFLRSKLPSSILAEPINNAQWDLKLRDATFQVKTRAVYRHNRDGIHIDLKSPIEFDYLFLLVVDEEMNHLAKIVLPKGDLLSLVRPHKSGVRLTDVRRHHPEWTQNWSLKSFMEKEI